MQQCWRLLINSLSMSMRSVHYIQPSSFVLPFFWSGSVPWMQLDCFEYHSLSISLAVALFSITFHWVMETFVDICHKRYVCVLKQRLHLVLCPGALSLIYSLLMIVALLGESLFNWMVLASEYVRLIDSFVHLSVHAPHSGTQLMEDSCIETADCWPDMLSLTLPHHSMFLRFFFVKFIIFCSGRLMEIW